MEHHPPPGSDTSSNALFGSLQSTTAQQINVSGQLE
ncbi:L-lactate permease [Escherichia coli]|nr:L-lactate permease [Escherichia coli]